MASVLKARSNPPKFRIGDTIQLCAIEKCENSTPTNTAVILTVCECRISFTDRGRYAYRLGHPHSTKRGNGQPWSSKAALLAETDKQLEAMRYIESLSEGERQQAQEVEDARQKQWQEDFERMKQEEDSQLYYVEGSDDGWFPQSKMRAYDNM